MEVTVITHSRSASYVLYSLSPYLPFLNDQISQIVRVDVCSNGSRISHRNIVNIHTRLNFNTWVNYYIYSPLLVQYMLTRCAPSSDRLIPSVWGPQLRRKSEDGMWFSKRKSFSSDWRLSQASDAEKYERTCYTTTTPPWWRNTGFVGCTYQPGWRERKHCLLKPRRSASHTALQSCRFCCFLLQIICVAHSISFTVL